MLSQVTFSSLLENWVWCSNTLAQYQILRKHKPLPDFPLEQGPRSMGGSFLKKVFIADEGIIFWGQIHAVLHGD